MRPIDKCFTLKEVEEITSFCKPTIYRLMKLGEFPLQVRISRNRVAWLESEINAWMAERASQRAS